MRINIYGVGRSGTKALQLYMAYHLAKKEGKIHLNYEPYFHCTRKGITSFRGIIHNINAPHFTTPDDQLSWSHQRFLRQLTRKTDISVVTKFIRANGRIAQIDSILKPDYSFVVVRDLYQALASVLIMDWDYYKHGYVFFPLTSINFLAQVIEDARKNGLIPTEYEEYLQDPETMDRVTANAFYWYFMNKAALAQKRENLFFIDYDQLEAFPNILHGLEPSYFDEELPLSDDKFKGSNIHSNNLFNSQHKNVYFRKRINAVNEILFYLFGRATKKSLVLVNRKQGEIIKLATTIENKQARSKKNIKQRVSVKSNPLLDKLNAEIKAELAVKLAEQSVQV